MSRRSAGCRQRACSGALCAAQDVPCAPWPQTLASLVLRGPRLWRPLVLRGPRLWRPLCSVAPDSGVPCAPWPQTLASLNGLLLPGGSAPKKGLFLRRVKQLLTVRAPPQLLPHLCWKPALAATPGTAPATGPLFHHQRATGAVHAMQAAMEFDRHGRCFLSSPSASALRLLAMIISEVGTQRRTHPCSVSHAQQVLLSLPPLSPAPQPGCLPSMRLHLQAGPDILETFDATTPSTLKSAGPWAKERNLFAWFVSDGAFRVPETGKISVWHAGQRAMACVLSACG